MVTEVSHILDDRPTYSAGDQREKLVGHIIDTSYQDEGVFKALVTSFFYTPQGNPMHSLYYFDSQEVEDYFLSDPNEYTVFQGFNPFPGEDYKGRRVIRIVSTPSNPITDQDYPLEEFVVGKIEGTDNCYSIIRCPANSNGPWTLCQKYIRLP